MIRVLNVVGLCMGGMEQFVMECYRNIDRAKVQFDFLYAQARGDYYEAEAKALGARVYKFPTGGKNYGGTKQKSLMWIVRFIREHPEYKIVHIHNTKPRIFVEVFLFMLSGVPVRIVHGHTAKTGIYYPRKERLYRLLLRIFTTYMFASSLDAGMSLFGEKVRSSKKFRVIKGTRELEQHRYNPALREQTRHKLNLEGKYVIINVARLAKQKNHKFLLDVFACVRNREPDAVLLIAGDGGLRGELESKIAAMGLENSVQLLGLRTDVSELLQASDVFAFPSLYEGLGSAAIEAQAAGLPCLISGTVPRAVKATDAVEFLPIDKGSEIWAERILAYKNFERKDTLEDVLNAGYDVKEAAKELEEIYLGTAH